jgi:hypothetical protein
MGDPRELEWAKKPDALKEGWTARTGTHMVHGVSPYRLVVVCQQRKPPPSRNSSEGGVDGGVSTKETPLRLAFRAREGLVVVRQKKPPLHLTFRAREGCVDRENPSILQFERGRGWWWYVDKRNPPLCLTFRGGFGGGVSTKKTPSVLQFEQGRGQRGRIQQHDEEKDIV